MPHNTLAKIPVISSPWHKRLRVRQESKLTEIWNLLDAVKDPEVPALSLWDLGVLRDIKKEDKQLQIIITPTYSGCPAIETMHEDIMQTLTAAGFDNTAIKISLSPAWSTDWLSPQGHEKLRDFGISPPACHSCENNITPEEGITCPHCHSKDTRRISEFGSTACKALFQCHNCAEPFDYFKVL